MTHILPYLHFNGSCDEAMHFYQQVLGGDLKMQKVGESPMAAQLTANTEARILYSTLRNEKLVLMASDIMNTKYITGNAIVLCLNCSTESEMYEIFPKLAAGGIVHLPVHQTFQGSCYGELTDQFGIKWILNFQRDMNN